MKKLLLIFAAALLLLPVGCKKQRSTKEAFKMEAEMITEKYCPRQIEEGIMFDSTTYSIEENALRYYYTMSAPYNNEEVIKSGRPKFREGLKAQIMSSIDLKKYKDEGVTFYYIYFSADTNKVLLEEVFTENDYVIGKMLEQSKQ